MKVTILKTIEDIFLELTENGKTVTFNSGQLETIFSTKQFDYNIFATVQTWMRKFRQYKTLQTLFTITESSTGSQHYKTFVITRKK